MLKVLVRERNDIVATPLKFRVSDDTDVNMLCYLQRPPATAWVPRCCPCGARDCVANPARIRQNVSSFLQDARNVRISYGKVNYYYFWGVSAAFSSEVKNLTFTSPVDSFASLQALLCVLLAIWGCSGQAYKLLLFKSKSTRFFPFQNSLIAPMKTFYVLTDQRNTRVQENDEQNRANFSFYCKETENHQWRNLHCVWANF